MLKGCLERVECAKDGSWVATGWAVDLEDIDRTVDIEIQVQSKILSIGKADISRDDLAESGYGNGRHGFQLIIPSYRLSHGKIFKFSVVSSGERKELVDEQEFQMNSLLGYLDRIDGIVVNGWAFDAANPSVPLSVDLLLDGYFAGRVVADRYREDLAEYAAGKCGFQWIVPENYIDGKQRLLTACLTNQSVFLQNALLLNLDLDILTPETRKQLLLRRFTLRQLQTIDELLYAEGSRLKGRPFISADDLLLDRLDMSPREESPRVPLLVTPKVGV